MRKNNKKGFTLVELLVVIAILAILASVAVVGYTAFVDKAKVSKAETELHQIVEYVNAELIDDGKWTVKVAGGSDIVVDETAADFATKLEAAIAACEDLGKPTNVTYDETDGLVFEYEEGKTVSEKLR